MSQFGTSTANVSTSVVSGGAVASAPRWRLWAGWAISALPILGLLMSAGMKITHPPDVMKMFTEHLGYSASVLPMLAALEITCIVLYAIPQTAVLGAILVSGYLGGAIATHVRVGESFAAPLAMAVLAWAGLYLREPRLHVLVPLRRLRE